MSGSADKCRYVTNWKFNENTNHTNMENLYNYLELASCPSTNSAAPLWLEHSFIVLLLWMVWFLKTKLRSLFFIDWLIFYFNLPVCLKWKSKTYYVKKCFKMIFFFKSIFSMWIQTTVWNPHEKGNYISTQNIWHLPFLKKFSKILSLERWMEAEEARVEWHFSIFSKI